MAEIELIPQTLIVHVTGADRLWALKSQLEVPLAHVTDPSRQQRRQRLGCTASGSVELLCQAC